MASFNNAGLVRDFILQNKQFLVKYSNRDAMPNPLKIGSNPYFHWWWCATGTWGLLCNGA